MSQQEPQLGYRRDSDLKKPFAHFLEPELPPLTPQAVEALQRGPRPPELFEPPQAGPLLQQDGYLPVETGYALTPSGGMIISCLHDMPGVTPAMWEWWFSWHGHESSRYKLWHPLAHVSAAWADGGGYTGEYIGRTSNVAEYIGGKLMKLGIHFVHPREFGFDEDLLKTKGEAVICAEGVQTRLTKVRVGQFLHHVRPTKTGSEMRSRFWLGGDNARRFGAKSSDFLTRTIASFIALQESDAVGLLVHNAEEMAHLAKFLPELYAEFHNSTD